MTGATTPAAGDSGRVDPPASGLARATLVQAVGTALSRITGFGRIFAFAYALGAGSLADTYTLANNTPNIIYELVLGGVLSGTLLPVFVRSLRGAGAGAGDGDRDGDDGWRAVSAVLTLAVVASAALAVAFVVLAPLFIRLYTLRTGRQVGDDQVAVATDLLRLFAPQVFFYGVISVTTALLRARRRFAAPMFAPVLNNLVVIAMFLAYPRLVGISELGELRGDRGAILLLGLATTAGVAAMTLGQLPLRTLSDHVRFVWDPGHPAVRTIVRLSTWTVGFVVANQVALFVVYLLANGRPGDVTVYFLSYTIFLLPHGIVSVSVISSLQPELADRWAEGDLAGFQRRLSLGLRTIASILVPAAVGYLVLARPIVAVLLEHGALGGADADRVAGTLTLMALGLPVFSAWLFVTSAYQAMQDTRTLFSLYLVENAVNIAGAVLFHALLGVQGLGLAFALAYGTGTVVALAHLRRRIGGVDGAALGRSLGRIGLGSAVMAGVVALVAANVGSGEGLAAVLRVGAATVAGVSVYLAAARFIPIGELEALLPFRRRG